MFLDTTFIDWFDNHKAALIFTVIVVLVFLALLILIKFIFTRIKKGKGNKVSSLVSIIHNVIKLILSIISIFIIIAIWGMNPTIGLVILCTFLLIIGISSYSTLSDLIVGMSNIFNNMYEVDNYVQINGFTGKVVSISLTRTKIESLNGEVMTISNGLIKEVINYSVNPVCASVDVEIENVKDIFEIITKIEEKIVSIKEDYPQIIEGPLVNGIENFNNGNVSIKIIAKTPYEKKQVVERAIRKKVLEVANKNGIRLNVDKIEVLK